MRDSGAEEHMSPNSHGPALGTWPSLRGKGALAPARHAKAKEDCELAFLIFWLVSIIAALVHLYVRRPTSAEKKLEMLLLYQMVFSIGVAGVIGFLGHCFNYEAVARSIGWLPHRQFQFELGSSELGWAIAGFLAIAIRRPLYWFGVSIIPSVMFFLSACQHIWEVVTTGNYAVNNVWAGIADFLVPLTLTVLFVGYYVRTRKKVRHEHLSA
jgi:hypothetical protein